MKTKKKPHLDLLIKSDLRKLSEAIERIKSTYTPELVIALCGPIGSPLREVSEALEKILKVKYGYEVLPPIKLSKKIEDNCGKAPKEAFDRYKYLIDKGNDLREKYHPAILAGLAVAEIAGKRELARVKDGSPRYKSIRRCHIIDSIKNEDELRLLKLVYGGMLYTIGVFAHRDTREANLEAKPMRKDQVHQLIDRDSGEEIANGQTVSKIFPEADFFLVADSGTDNPVKEKIERFLEIIFQTNESIETPTIHERAMYLAASSAVNSACLSRQVGACITDKDGVVISVGWNDVPKKGGNLYHCESKNDSGGDNRCFKDKYEGGKCFKDFENIEITSKISQKLLKSFKEKIRLLEEKAPLFKEKTPLLTEEDMQEIISNALIMEKTGVKDLIEFSRSTHAEMHAMIIGAQMSGNKMVGGKLYSTLYPCHPCARHIVVAGIKEVYYIEAYPKSKAVKLHKDALQEKLDASDPHEKVLILPFDGVAPNRYLELFRMKPESRKYGYKDGDKIGKKKIVSPKTVLPQHAVTLESLEFLEMNVIEALADKLL